MGTGIATANNNAAEERVPATAATADATTTADPRSSAIPCAVITVSDRCARGQEVDLSGPVLRKALAKRGYRVDLGSIIPDDLGEIYKAVRDALVAGARVIITSGGTGVGPRDVTPEAVASFIATPLPAMEQLYIQESLRQTHFAALSRGRMGLTATTPKSLVICLPGSVKAAELAADVLFPLFNHALDQMDQTGVLQGKYSDHGGPSDDK